MPKMDVINVYFRSFQVWIMHAIPHERPPITMDFALLNWCDEVSS